MRRMRVPFLLGYISGPYRDEDEINETALTGSMDGALGSSPCISWRRQGTEDDVALQISKEAFSNSS